MELKTSLSESDTKQAGIRLAARLHEKYLLGKVKRPVCIFLQGTLGSGKTTFCRGFISEWIRLTCPDLKDLPVTSPTYNIVRTYGSIAHFDLYRVRSTDELMMAGLDHYLAISQIILFEWPEIVGELQLMLKGYDMIRVEIEHSDENQRVLKTELNIC